MTFKRGDLVKIVGTADEIIEAVGGFPGLADIIGKYLPIVYQYGNRNAVVLYNGLPAYIPLSNLQLLKEGVAIDIVEAAMSPEGLAMFESYVQAVYKGDKEEDVVGTDEYKPEKVILKDFEAVDKLDIGVDRVITKIVEELIPCEKPKCKTEFKQGRMLVRDSEEESWIEAEVVGYLPSLEFPYLVVNEFDGLKSSTTYIGYKFAKDILDEDGEVEEHFVSGDRIRVKSICGITMDSDECNEFILGSYSKNGGVFINIENGNRLTNPMDTDGGKDYFTKDQVVDWLEDIEFERIID